MVREITRSEMAEVFALRRLPVLVRFVEIPALSALVRCCAVIETIRISPGALKAHADGSP